MDLIVAKFGGTSVGDGSRIRKAAQSVVNEYMKGNQLDCSCFMQLIMQLMS